MKKTAVEWLVEQLKESGIPLLKDEFEMVKKAKEKEKKQIIETFKNACWYREKYERVNVSVSANDYYNQNYSNEKI